MLGCVFIYSHLIKCLVGIVSSFNTELRPIYNSYRKITRIYIFPSLIRQDKINKNNYPNWKKIKK